MNTKSGSGRLLALVLCALVSGCDKAAPTAIDVVPRVKTVEVGELARGQARRLSGKLVAALSSPLSFGVAGTVAQVQVESGQTVLAGTLLAQLDPEPLRVALEQARAKLAIARANSAEARQSFERITVLLKQNASSQMELDRATADYSTARGNLRTAQGDLEQRERDLGRTDLVAPYDGAIASRSVEPFQEIGGNTEAFLLDSSDAMEVEVRVPETIIRYISYGQTVAVTFPTFADLSLPGEVAKIGSRAESGNAFPVSVRLTNGAVDLRPGMTASVTFHIDSHAGDAPVYTLIAPLAVVFASFQVESEAHPFAVNDRVSLADQLFWHLDASHLLAELNAILGALALGALSTLAALARTCSKILFEVVEVRFHLRPIILLHPTFGS